MKFNCIVVIATLSLLLFHSAAYSQQWPGYETGRFTGISSATLRPAGMAAMPFKVDATLFGAHLNTKSKNIFGSDFLDVVFSGGFKSLSGFSELRSRTNVFSNLQGPSIQVRAHERVSLAFAWNIRYLWLSDFSEPDVARLFDKAESSLALNAENESTHILYTGWDEFGLGAAGILFEEDFHKFSAGAFVKLVFGTGHMNINIEHLDVTSSGSMIRHMGFSIDSEASDNINDLVDEGKLHFADKVGYGFDIGAEYRMISLRSCPGASNYRLKAGFALNDIGKARYKSATLYSKKNAGTDNISREAFLNGSLAATADTLREIFNIDESVTPDYSVTLPMSLRVYCEVTVRRRAIVYSEFHFMFAQLANPELPMLFRFNLTPRFEDDRYGIYVPLTFTNYIPADAGLAIRLKPVVIGSGNLFTFWAYDRNKALDFFVTLKIPILNPDERIDWKVMGPRSRKTF